jgi:hypothetical protein
MSPTNEEPGFENDVDELPDDAQPASPETLENTPKQDATDADELEAAQEDAAEERKEGGYQ